MKLYELTDDFREAFIEYEQIINFEPETDENGRFLDVRGNIIDDVAEYKEKMLKAWSNTLEGLDGEFDLKIENLAVYIKSLIAEAKAIKNEESALKCRRTRIEKSVDWLKLYVLNNMNALGKTKIDMPRAVVDIRQNPISVVIANEYNFINWAQENNRNDLLRYKQPEINKVAVKNELKGGAELPGATTVRNLSVVIK